MTLYGQQEARGVPVTSAYQQRTCNFELVNGVNIKGFGF